MDQVKILIVVSGGVVQSVFGSDQNISIELLDFDNEELMTEEEAKAKFDERKNGLFDLTY